MIKLLFTKNPDNGNQIPVVVDTPDIDVTSVTLKRNTVEGNHRALRADVSFATSQNLPKPGQEHQLRVYLHVLTENHAAPMTESTTIRSVSELTAPWDMYSASGGHGDIHAVLVKTFLDEPDTF